MEIRTARGDVKPAETVVGPTLTLINRDARAETVADSESGTTRHEWVYTQYALESGEYEMIIAGSLPEGAEWDATLRDIERSGLHAETTNDTMQALRKLREGDTSTDWQAWLDALDAYNLAIEETKNQEGYPLKVTYPEYPKKPE